MNSNIKIIAVEPTNSAVISKNKPGAHKIQGIGAGFIPNTLDVNIIDEIITIDDDKAYDIARIIAKEEGILVGISSGAAMAAAIKVANKTKGNIVVILPDTGERYLSTDLFKGD